LIAHQVHRELPLVVAANRDEFHARPAQKMHWWVDDTNILGGRDLQAGGSWLGVHRNGRFATVTNFRDAIPTSGNLLSRGSLVTDFLRGQQTPLEYLRSIDGTRFAGFNLLVAAGGELAYLSNKGGECAVLAPGLYGVANASLDNPWPKVRRGRAAVQTLLDDDNVNESTLFRVLADTTVAASADIETRGLPFAKARAMSAPFIVLPDYGTRCSTVLLQSSSGTVRVSEKRFAPDGHSTGQSDFRFDL
jgi:uncharacterized protein with NRDE domain